MAKLIPCSFLLAPVLMALAGAGAAQIEVRRARVEVRERQVVEPADRRLMVQQGDRVVIEWHADERGEVHLHGYDVTVALDPDRPANMSIEARATGRFPISAHGFGAETGHGHGRRALMYLEVHPK